MGGILELEFPCVLGPPGGLGGRAGGRPGLISLDKWVSGIGLREGIVLS